MARTKGAVEVDVHLVLALAAMVLEHELEKHAYFGGLWGKRDEDRDVGGVVLGILSGRSRLPTGICPL
jgi:hypothetical protein